MNEFKSKKGEAMGCITECEYCHFYGTHGFSSVVAGIMHFYHLPQVDNCQGFYEFNNERFLSLDCAWAAARIHFPDDAWRKGWDARILEKDQEKASKFFKAWLSESHPPATGSVPPHRPSRIVR